MERKSKLYIETDHGQSEAEIVGTPSEIMFNWSALTNQICLKLNLSPTQLAFMLPGMLGTCQRILRESVEVDLAAARGQKKEGQP